MSGAEITLNGKPHPLPENPTSLSKLTESLKICGPVAIALNGEVIPLSDWSKQDVCAGDCVEVVQAVGGG